MASKNDIYLNRLQSKEYYILKHAIQYFVFHPDIRCIQPIRNILSSSKDEKIIRWSSYALAKNNDKESINLIESKISEINDPDSQAVEWLKISREIILDTKDTKHITDLLNSSSIDDIKEALVLSFAYQDKSDSLIKDITNIKPTADPDVRRWINLTLGNTKGFKNAEVITQYLSDDYFLVCEWAAWALSNLQDKNTITSLQHHISHPHPRVREWIAKALSRFNSFTVWLFLMNHFYMEDDILCKEGIIRSLSPGNNQSQDFLYDCLIKHKDNEDITLLLATLDKMAEGTIEERFFPILKDILIKQDNHNIREAVAFATLTNMDKEAIHVLKNIISDPKYEIINDCCKEVKYLLDNDNFLDSEIYDASGNIIPEGLINEVISAKYNTIYTPLLSDNLRKSTATYVVYDNNIYPKYIISEIDLEKYIRRRDKGEYDIWIREPKSEIYIGSKQIKRRPEERIIRLLKAIFRATHQGFIPLVDLYRDFYKVSYQVSQTDARNRVKGIQNAISLFNVEYGEQLELKFLYDDHSYRAIFIKIPSFCLIELADNRQEQS